MESEKLTSQLFLIIPWEEGQAEVRRVEALKSMKDAQWSLFLGQNAEGVLVIVLQQY